MDVPRRPLLRLVALIVGTAALGVVGWLVMRGGGAGGASSNGDDGAAVTAPVERRVLESLQVTRGTVFAPSQASVLAGAPGEGELAVVVTSLPLAHGADVGAGAVVVEMNGRPVFALPGAVPVYRDMRPGDVGPDVGAVQDALHVMGNEIPESERSANTFGYYTQRAIRNLYENAGYEPSYTLGSRDAVVDAETEATAAVGAAQSALSDATAAEDAMTAQPNATGSVPSDEVEAAQSALDDATAARDRVQAGEGVVLPAREFVAVPSLPAVLVELPVTIGESVEQGTSVAKIGANDFRVRVELTSAQYNELADDVEISVFSDRGYEAACPWTEPRPEGAPEGGQPGSAETGEASTDPAASEALGGDDAVADGASGDTAGGTTSSDSSDAYIMDVACDPLPPADALGANLRVTMTVRRSDGEVLVVPATAVTTSPSGETFVEVAGADGEPTRIVVAVGGEADGFIEVAPVDGDDSLAEGMDVRVRRS